MRGQKASEIFAKMEADPLVRKARDEIHEFCMDHATLDVPSVGRVSMREWKALCEAWGESGQEPDKFLVFARTWLHLHRSAEGEL